MVESAIIEEYTALAEERQDLAQFLVRTVANDLCRMVSDSRKGEVRLAAKHAVKLLEEYRIETNPFDEVKESAWEKGALLLGIANIDRTHGAGTPFADYAFPIGTLLTMAAPNQQDLLRIVEQLPAYKKKKVFCELLKSVWPELNGDINKIRDAYAVNGIVCLPFTKRILNERMLSTAAHMGISADWEMFKGAALPAYKVGFITQDPDEVSQGVTEEHERQHINYSGLNIGIFGLGQSLNEGMTEYRACKTLGLDPLNHTNSYREERRVIHTLHQKKDISRTLTQRYENKTLRTVRNLHTVLVNDFGISGMYALYAANPYAVMPNELQNADVFQFPYKNRIDFTRNTGFISTAVL